MTEAQGRAGRHAWLASFASGLRERLAGHRAVARLGALDDRMLKDIGLYRTDIDPGALRRAACDRKVHLASR